jgi:hypothetical protein
MTVVLSGVRPTGMMGTEPMADERYLTTEEVAERYRGEVSVGTLENWRSQRIGPAFVKIGKAVLYPVEELDAWDRRNLVACDDARVVGRRRHRGDREAGSASFR